MSDSSKVVLHFAAGAVELVGTEQFVIESVARFAQKQDVDGPAALLEQSVGHAWDWFALHANQRMQAVNFFLLASAFLTAAYGSAIQYAHPIAGVGVASLGVLFCVVFYAFELRIRELIKTGEKALSQAQEKLAATTGFVEFEICKRVEKPKYAITSYHKVISGLYLFSAITFFIGIVYALHLSGRPALLSGIDYRSVIDGLHRLILDAGGVLLIFWAQRLIRNHGTPHWLSVAAAIALTGTGIFVLVVTILKPLTK